MVEGAVVTRRNRLRRHLFPSSDRTILCLSWSVLARLGVLEAGVGKHTVSRVEHLPKTRSPLSDTHMDGTVRSQRRFGFVYR